MAAPAFQISPLTRLLLQVSKPLLDTHNASFRETVQSHVEPWREHAEIGTHLTSLFLLLSSEETAHPSREALASAVQQSIESAAASLDGEQKTLLRSCHRRLNEIAGEERTWPISGFFRKEKMSRGFETRKAVFLSIGGAVHDANNTLMVLLENVKMARQERPEILDTALGRERIDKALAIVQARTRSVMNLVATLRMQIASMRDVEVDSLDDLKGLLLSGGYAKRIHRGLLKIQERLELIREDMVSAELASLELFTKVEDGIQLIGLSASLFEGLVESHSLLDIPDSTEPVEPATCLRPGVLQSTLGNKVDLRLNLLSTWKVRGPFSLVLELVLNLAGNAGRVMKDPGALEISTHNVVLSEGGFPAHQHRNGEMRGGEYVLLTFRDTGPGIPRDRLGDIFGLFHSGHDSSGYGLALTEAIVHEMGGFIGVDSWTEGTPGESKGAQFSIYLPRVIPQIASTQAG